MTVNADAARRLLAGEPGPVRDAVLVNAAAALVAYDGIGATDDELRDGLAAGMERAATAIDSGAAAASLARWVEVAKSAL